MSIGGTSASPVLLASRSCHGRETCPFLRNRRTWSGSSTHTRRGSRNRQFPSYSSMQIREAFSSEHKESFAARGEIRQRLPCTDLIFSRRKLQKQLAQPPPVLWPRCWQAKSGELHRYKICTFRSLNWPRSQVDCYRSPQPLRGASAVNRNHAPAYTELWRNWPA
jgi:hypothetical protein